MKKVLLLDSALSPIRPISWKRAMILCFQKKAHVLEEQMSSVSGETWSYKIPSVIQLKNYSSKQWDRHVRFNRKNVFLRDNFMCQYCYQKFAPQRLTLEHVVPRCRGGGTSWSNVVTACRPCNQKKGHRLPHEAGMKLRHNPTKPQGLDFFFFWLPTDIPEDWEPYVGWIREKMSA